MKRRDFLRLIGILSGSTLASSCGSPKGQKKLISYIKAPEEGMIPGEASFHPGTCTECPAGCGLLVKVREGWPVKLEGAPGHPISDGALCVRGQASLSRLYHPDRLKRPMARNSSGILEEVSWEKALSLVARSLKDSAGRGRKNVYLSGRSTGTLSSLIDDFCRMTGVSRLPGYEVFSHAAIRKACRILSGEGDVPRFRVEDADFLLTMGADILETFVSPVSFALQLTRAKERPGFRWFHVEPHLSLTGANADKRITIEPMAERHLLTYLIGELIGEREAGGREPAWFSGAFPPLPVENVSKETGIPPGMLREIARRFAAARSPLLVAGGVATSHRGGLEVALLATIVQWMTSEKGATTDFVRGENYAMVGTAENMEALAGRLGGGEIGVIFISRADPVGTLPPGYFFREKLAGAEQRVVIDDRLSETARQADVLLPISHALESWGDAEPRVGTWSLIKPVVNPLYETLAEGDILIRLAGKLPEGEFSRTHRDYLFDAWKEIFGEAGRGEFLQEGFIEQPHAGKEVSIDWEAVRPLITGTRAGARASKPLLILAPSIRTFDGRSRDLPLLAEIPDPLTTVSYGRFISVSEADARTAGLREKDEVTIRSGDFRDTLAVFVQPGLPEGVFTVLRDTAGPVEVDAAAGSAIDYIEGIEIGRAGRRASLPILSGSFSQEGRGIIPDPVHREKGHHGGESLYAPHEHDDYRWAMAVDLDTCTGCSACVAACYVENNVPVVGKRDHLRGREMSWLRVEPFYDGDGGVDFVPMMCQHCHYAPCEPVCPVYAAYHNPEGLNVQVYNRCVGTRYCSNNCPYKVRRFNWFQHLWKKPLDRMLNPDILVRGMGVMEKCTFCIQRLRVAKDRAKDESRKVVDGEVTTACAQSCPTGAIVFGNLLDKKSRVYELSHSGRAYRVFEELGTESSVYYLKKKRKGHGA